MLLCSKQAYNTTYKFANKELVVVVPEDIVHWFNQLAYGALTPSNNDKPTLCCKGTPANRKKKLSCFMPNKSQQDEVTCCGNPTKSNAVRIVLRNVKRTQVCREEAPSQAT